MSYLYVNENGTIVDIEGNRFTVKYKDGMLKSVPAETLEGMPEKRNQHFLFF